jgi:hypothetical protein
VEKQLPEIIEVLAGITASHYLRLCRGEGHGALASSLTKYGCSTRHDNNTPDRMRVAQNEQTTIGCIGVTHRLQERVIARKNVSMVASGRSRVRSPRGTSGRSFPVGRYSIRLHSILARRYRMAVLIVWKYTLYGQSLYLHNIGNACAMADLPI